METGKVVARSLKKFDPISKKGNPIGLFFILLFFIVLGGTYVCAFLP